MAAATASGVVRSSTYVPRARHDEAPRTGSTLAAARRLVGQGRHEPVLGGGGGGGGAGLLVFFFVVVLDEEEDDEEEEEDDEDRDDDELEPTVELPGAEAAAIVTCLMTVFFVRSLVTTTGFSLAHLTRASWWVLAAAAFGCGLDPGLLRVLGGGLLGGGGGGHAGPGDRCSSERAAQHGEHDAGPVSLTGAQQGSHGCGPLVGSWHGGSRCRERQCLPARQDRVIHLSREG